MALVVPGIVAKAMEAERMGAHVLILGCTGMAGMTARIQDALAECGCEVPVLDPPAVAIKLAESLVDLGQSHSKRTYPYPPAREIRWPTSNGFST
jgi:allantoin racemase